MGKDKKANKGRAGEKYDGYSETDEACDQAPKGKMNKKLKQKPEVGNGIFMAAASKEDGANTVVEPAAVFQKKSSRSKKQLSNKGGQIGAENQELDASVKSSIVKGINPEDEVQDIAAIKGLKKSKQSNKSVLDSDLPIRKSGFQLLDMESDVEDNTSNLTSDPGLTSFNESESKGGKKSKKTRRKKEDDDEDISKLLEELALEMTGQQPSNKSEQSAEVELQNSETKTKKKKSKKDNKDSEDKQDMKELAEQEEKSTVKSAAQKKKEKKERERQKKIVQYEQTKSAHHTDSVSMQEDNTVIFGQHELELVDEDKDDGESKKKKKRKEDEKKEKKRPGKKQIAAMQEALKRVKEEEERLKKEEEARIRAEEEAERLRQEKLKLEQERKEKKKQKEKEKRERLKAEGKLLSKSQRQNRARMEATLAALREQGVEVPQIGEKKDRAPRLGDRKKVLKKKSDISQDVLSEEGCVDAFPEIESTDTVPERIPTPVDMQAKEEESDVKDAWDESSEDESEVSKVDFVEKSSEESEEEGSEESESESDESYSEDESSSSETDGKKNEEKIKERVLERIEKRREENENNRSTAVLRSPVVCVLGHVDTGKTKILDKIRRTHVQDSEAGGITQQIGATMVPEEALKEQCKMVKNFVDIDLRLPGLLIIDTPGHESFSNLRSRGSSLCDIAVLVVDIMHGIEPQTIESIDLLKTKKTPFIVALNKIDRLYEWKSIKNKDIVDVIKAQARNTRMEFDDRAKEVVLQFANQGLNAVLCYDNTDPRSFISMVPTSAATGDGMGNLMALIVQLTQQMMAKRLSFSEELQATVLEVKAIPGLGTTIDVILVNGRLREGDTIVLAGYEGPVVTQIRSLLMPQPLKELRVKNPYQEYKEVQGAQGVKITGKDLDKAIAGLQLLVAHSPDEIPILKEEVTSSFTEAMNHIKLAERGVYVQASTLGSLEALLEFLKSSKIPFAGIRIGPVVKKDVMKASIMLEHDSQYAVILAFDVKVERDAQELADSLGVRIFQADIIYHLFDKFMAYRDELRNKKRDEFKSVAIFPCKLRILPQYIFNSRDPIVVGVIVEAGVVKEGTPLCVPSKEFLEIGTVTTIEVNHKPIENARKGQEVCIKIEPSGGEAPKMYGRHFEHTDILVSKITRQSIDVCKEFFRDDLLKSDWQLMVELKKIFQIL